MTSHCFSRLILWNKLPRALGYYLLMPTYNCIVKIKAEIIFAVFRQKTSKVVQILRCGLWCAGQAWTAGLNIPLCVLNTGWIPNHWMMGLSMQYQIKQLQGLLLTSPHEALPKLQLNLLHFCCCQVHLPTSEGAVGRQCRLLRSSF